jgi:hypothetical protein
VDVFAIAIAFIGVAAVIVVVCVLRYLKARGAERARLINRLGDEDRSAPET